MDAFFILGAAITVSILISIITAFLISYKCQKAILQSQVQIELKLAQERSYIDQLKINLEDYLRKMTKISKKGPFGCEKTQKINPIMNFESSHLS